MSRDQGRRRARVRPGPRRRGGRAGRPPGDRVPARAGRLVPADRATCSTSTSRSTARRGTYVRALARDLGARARRRRPPDRAAPHPGRAVHAGRRASPSSELAERADPVPIPLDAAVAAAFPRRDLTADEADRLSHGGRLEPARQPGPVGAFGPDGASSRWSRTAPTPPARWSSSARGRWPDAAERREPARSDAARRAASRKQVGRRAALAGVRRARRPAGDAASSPSASSTACTAGTSRSSAARSRGPASSACRRSC